MINWNPYILKEISPEYSMKGLMMKLKLQYFGHLMRRPDSLEKTLMLGKIEGRRRRGMTEDEMAGWHHWLSGLSLSKVRELVMDREAWRAAVHGITKSQTQLNWTEPTPVFLPGNSMDRGSWWATVHGVTKTWLRDQHFHGGYTLKSTGEKAIWLSSRFDVLYSWMCQSCLT